MKRLFQILFAGLLALTLFVAPVLAQTSILPDDADAKDMTEEECLMYVLEQETAHEDSYAAVVEGESQVSDKLLACAIKSGYVKFWMLPFFVRNALAFLINLSAIFAVLMIVVGAYYYIAGGLTEDKEKGKTIIKYALGGLVLTVLAWVIVNAILLAVTS